MRMSSRLSDVLFLDDNPERGGFFVSHVPNTVWVSTAEKCIECLALDKKWDQVLLDHDLGNEIFRDSSREDTGMEVVRWIVKNKPKHLKDTTFIIHTHNYPAGVRMREELVAAGYNAICMPFASIKAMIEGEKK